VECESVLKQFIFTDKGRFYIYSSSVPDEVHPDDQEDAKRYDTLH